MGDKDMSYADVQRVTWRVARAFQRAGVKPGDKVAILSSNDPVAFACVFGISRAGAVWCPINPRNEAAENRFILDAFDCTSLIFHSAYAPLVDQMRADLPKLSLLVCLDRPMPFAPALDAWLDGVGDELFEIAAADDIAMIAGTGGTTGQPKGVMLSGRNLETMSALTLMSYPFEGRPVYLALAPLTHAAGVLCFPILALGGRIVIMPKADLSEFLDLIERRRVTHTFLPPTLIYMLLENPNLAATDRSSLQCFWYGAAPISVTRLEEAIEKIGPVMAQLFGQTEAPMMISTMAPKDHFNADGTIARQRLASAGRPTPLTQLAVMDDDGPPSAARGARRDRGARIARDGGLLQEPEATAEVTRFGWHHTGDIGYLDEENFLFIVDRAKDMIITGGFNVYSIEVEQALLQHPDVMDSAVFGLPDAKWGERVAAVVQVHAGRSLTPKSSCISSRRVSAASRRRSKWTSWPDLPRSKVGKVLKKEIRAKILSREKGADLGGDVVRERDLKRR